MLKTALILLSLAAGALAHAEESYVIYAGKTVVQKDGRLVHVVVGKFNSNDECSSFISANDPSHDAENAIGFSYQTPQLEVRQILVKRGFKSATDCGNELQNYNANGFYCSTVNALFCSSTGEAATTIANGPSLQTRVRTEIVKDKALNAEITKTTSENVEYK